MIKRRVTWRVQVPSGSGVIPEFARNVAHRSRELGLELRDTFDSDFPVVKSKTDLNQIWTRLEPDMNQTWT